ncbi:hypothetical protein BASA83_003388 [Batrachochytrium salamandrivorans]|nr:hypothetical protein BASA83_003388 [Batrachochytrium salamandrivorans]
MKFHAFSLIAMFMVTANALAGPMDCMDGASGLVQATKTLLLPTPDFELIPTIRPNPTPVPRSNPTPPPVLALSPAPSPAPRRRSRPRPRPTFRPRPVL